MTHRKGPVDIISATNTHTYLHVYTHIHRCVVKPNVRKNNINAQLRLVKQSGVSSYGQKQQCSHIYGGLAGSGRMKDGPTYTRAPIYNVKTSLLSNSLGYCLHNPFMSIAVICQI